MRWLILFVLAFLFGCSSTISEADIKNMGLLMDQTTKTMKEAGIKSQIVGRLATQRGSVGTETSFFLDAPIEAEVIVTTVVDPE